MDTLGRLIDNLLIVNLKLRYKDKAEARADLFIQANRLLAELAEFVRKAFAGEIPNEWITAPMHKIHRKRGKKVQAKGDNLLQLVQGFAETQHQLWQTQDKIDGFSGVPANEKDAVVESCVVLNLKRNNYIDAIDRLFFKLVEPI